MSASTVSCLLYYKRFLRLVALIAGLSILKLTCAAQQTREIEVSDSDKKAALKLVYAQCPEADVLEIESKEQYIEVEYVCRGVLYEVGIAGQRILYTEAGIRKEDIDFDKIEKKIVKNYPGYLLDEFSLITTPDTSFIRVEIVKEGVEHNVYFTAEGKWYNAETDFVSGELAGKYAEIYTALDPPYNFLQPDALYEMPDILREISGISYFSEDNLLCVQDELGVVFKYHLKSEEISAIYRFTDVGDFEDLAVQNDTVSVLRSDGTVFEFCLSDYNGTYRQYLVPTQSMDLEGLAFTGKSLLISGKEPAAMSNAQQRSIYRLEPGLPKTVEVWHTINSDTIQNFFKAKYPALLEGKVHFNPSAIAVHPTNGELYVLSAKDRLLAIYNGEHLKSLYPLPESIYYKPEGLAFSPTGDLFISSEGDKKGLVKGRIMRFAKK